MFFRSASPQKRRQIQTHDKRPASSPNSLSNEAQAQPRERPHFGGKVCETIALVFPSDNLHLNCDRSNINSVKEVWRVPIISCFRRERALSRSSGRAAQRAAPAPAVFNRPQSPTSTWSPTPSPTSPLPTHVYYAPVMDEPLALIKKPRKDPENTEEKTKSSAATQIQVIHLNTQRDAGCLDSELDSGDGRAHL